MTGYFPLCILTVFTLVPLCAASTRVSIRDVSKNQVVSNTSDSVGQLTNLFLRTTPSPVKEPKRSVNLDDEKLGNHGYYRDNKILNKIQNVLKNDARRISSPTRSPKGDYNE